MTHAQDSDRRARMMLRAYEYEEQLRAEGRPDARSIARRAYGLDATPCREADPDEVIAALPATPRDVRAAMVEHYASAQTPQGDPRGEHLRQRHRLSDAAKRERQPERDPARLDLRRVGHRGKRVPGSRWGWTGGTP